MTLRISSSLPMTAVFLQNLVFRFRRLVRHPLTPSDFGQCLIYPVFGYVQLFEHRSGLGLFCFGHGDQKMLHADILVLQSFRFLFRLSQYIPQSRGEVNLLSLTGCICLRQKRDLVFQPFSQRRDVYAHLAEDDLRQALPLFQKRQKEMLGLNLGIVAALRQLLRIL
jgi:hypothetical protein